MERCTERGSLRVYPVFDTTYKTSEEQNRD